MTEHLPECPMKPIADGPVDFHRHFPDCICPALRACEQRSYALGIEVGKHDGWVAGHAAGVQAARDAVAEVEHIGYYAEEVRDAALAAIDALPEADRG